MSRKTIKFDNSTNMKFVELYRSYECLWNTEAINYKNRDARDAALHSFTNELAIEEFGPKEITLKIKNIRSQYLQERKKVKASVGTGAGASNVYVPKLPWYEALDSFLRKPSEFRQTTTNLIINAETAGHDDNAHELTNTEEIPLETVNADIEIVDLTPKPKHAKKTENKPLDIDLALSKLESIDKRCREREDDLDTFGQYVASSLRKLNDKNAINAQDEIQGILSKYKLRNLRDSTPMPESPFSLGTTSERHWWHTEETINEDYIN